MNHVDLFSGIGGFALAAEWTGFKTVVFCEKDEFCQKVLQKHWPEVPIIPEIRDFDGTKWRGTTLLTGGFPCQPFSLAGKRKGKDDDRYLWPEMFRVIKEAKPRWILAENVAGILKVALDTVLADLESEGYSAGAVVIPAASVNAPHRRDRVWIIAYNEGGRIQGGSISIRSRQSKKTTCDIDWSNKDAPHSLNNGMRGGDHGDSKRGKCTLQTEGSTSHTPHTQCSRLEKSQTSKFEKLLSDAQRRSWQIPWIEVATRFCRVDDGVPNRVDRLKSLGNAIVPQVAEVIMSGIKMIEENNAKQQSTRKVHRRIYGGKEEGVK